MRLEILPGRSTRCAMNGTRRSRLTLLLLFMLLTSVVVGCTSTRLTFDKAGVAQADLERDQNTCLRASIATDNGTILAPYCLDRDVFVRCMEARGYTVSSQ